jgi:DNA-binding CsgD family transcriptional regulator
MAMYDKGITFRTIYLDSVRKDKRTLSQMHWLCGNGSDVRTAPTLPIQLIICDGETVALPLMINGQNEGIAIYRDQSILIAIQALFDITWASSKRLGLTSSSKRSELTNTQHVVLEQLALGCDDSEIGKRMGVDKRTVRRRVSELMKHLGATTRFEAGFKAARDQLT